eukprot:1157619-Pelagomonas_calceolata.AAC.28
MYLVLGLKGCCVHRHKRKQWICKREASGIKQRLSSSAHAIMRLAGSCRLCRIYLLHNPRYPSHHPFWARSRLHV